MTGDEPFNYFMAIHFPDTNLKILDYNRVLKTLNGISNDEFLARVSESYDVSPIEEGSETHPRSKGECSLYLEKKWFHLKVKESKLDHSNLVKMLDS